MNRPLALGIGAAAAVLGTSIMLATPASARPGGVFVETFTSDAVVCRTTTVDEQYRVQARVFLDDRGMNIFQLQVYENFGSVELVEEAFGEPVWGEGTVTASGPMIDADGAPLPGESTMTATFTVSDQTITERSVVQDGNQRIVAEFASTEFVLDEVAVTVPGRELNPLDCIGSTVTETRTFTTPARYVDVTRSFEIAPDPGCRLGDADVSAQIEGRALELTINNLPGGEVATGTLRLRGDSGSGDLAIIDEAGSRVGTAAATATVTRSGPTRFEELAEEGVFLARKVTPYVLELTVTLPAGSASVGCDMELVTQRVRIDAQG